MPRTAALKLQMWGNSLAVRIPSEIARSARLSPGQPVELKVEEVGVSIIPVGKRDMTLSERLQHYDATVHGGEAMASRRVGRESS